MYSVCLSFFVCESATRKLAGSTRHIQTDRTAGPYIKINSGYWAATQGHSRAVSLWLAPQLDCRCVIKHC